MRLQTDLYEAIWQCEGAKDVAAEWKALRADAGRKLNVISGLQE
jgi:hypothetical protein